MNSSKEKDLRIATKSGAKLDATFLRYCGDEVAGVLLVHGITADKNEGGMYQRLAADLDRTGISTMRFSFSGHGESSGSDLAVNLQSQIEELECAVSNAKSFFGERPFFIVASSFGAVSTLSLDASLLETIDGLVLWNPVLSVEHTFFEPELEWGLENFGADRISQLAPGEFISVDGFRLSREFFESLGLVKNIQLRPIESLNTLIVHGTDDSYVSFEIAKETSSSSDFFDFLEINGSDHGFDGEAFEALARRRTVEWIVENA